MANYNRRMDTYARHGVSFEITSAVHSDSNGSWTPDSLMPVILTVEINDAEWQVIETASGDAEHKQRKFVFKQRTVDENGDEKKGDT